MKGKPPFDVKTGKDGKRYIVFPSSHEREAYAKRNPGEMDGFKTACFDGYDNAYCIDRH